MISCSTVLILGIGKGFLINLLFTSQKSLKKQMVLSFFGIMKDGNTHSDAGCLFNTPVDTVSQGHHRVQLVRWVAQEPLARGSNPSGARVQWIDGC